MVVTAVAAAWGMPRLGVLLYAEDALQHADIIFVLGGSRLERPLEAVDLYHAGYAPRVLLSPPYLDGGELALRARGVVFESEGEWQKNALVRMGVPAEAIAILEEGQGSTASEGQALRDAAVRHGWSRAIVVTERLHTRRAGMAMRRALAGTSVEVVVRASRYDTTDVEHWWHTRADLRFTLFELQKLVAYAAGIAG